MITTVEHRACQCCPHTELSDLERDRLARAVWDNCPDSGCLRAFCRYCSPPRRLHVIPPTEEALERSQGLMPSG